jgi:hypothetical protein
MRCSPLFLCCVLYDTTTYIPGTTARCAQLVRGVEKGGRKGGREEGGGGGVCNWSLLVLNM